jgi:hypothetical protein
VKIRSVVLSTMLAALGLSLALSPGRADAFGSLQHVNFGGGHSGFGGGHSGFGGGHSASGGGHSSGGHAAGPVGGWSGHGSGGWSGHSWQGRPGGWNGWHHHHFRDGVFFDFGFWGPYWDPWPWGWNYPYYYAPSYPVYVAPEVSPVPSAPPPPSYWYYCPSAKAYYPYVSQCPVPWVPVSPTPPG